MIMVKANGEVAMANSKEIIGDGERTTRGDHGERQAERELATFRRMIERHGRGR